MEAARNSTFDRLELMEARDREVLLASDPSLWLGKIIELNREPRYHNRLDAIALLSNLNELSNGTGLKARA